MKILVTGANGFIGSHIVSQLLHSGHQVVCCVRSVANTRRRYPHCDVIACDYNQDHTVDFWLSRLDGIDAVVNCVGILQSTAGNNIDKVHSAAPIALFKACKSAGVKKIIQISAQGAAEDGSTAYAISKAKADNALLALDVNAAVLRPSLVYGTGSYGGTSLFRGMAGMFVVLPLVGKGDTEFQPIYVKDLAKVVNHYIEQASMPNGVVNAVGPQRISLKNILLKLRKWLGLAKPVILQAPVALIKCAAKLGDLIKIGPVNSTSINMLLGAKTVDSKAFAATLNFKLMKFDEVFDQHPAQTQDLWQARLYFLKPLLKFSLALLWLATGVLSISVSRDFSYWLLQRAGIADGLANWCVFGAATIDIILGFMLLMSKAVIKVGIIQIFLIVVYTVLASITIQGLWVNPFAPLIKNIPLIVATLMMIAIERER